MSGTQLGLLRPLALGAPVAMTFLREFLDTPIWKPLQRLLAETALVWKEKTGQDLRNPVRMKGVNSAQLLLALSRR
jgi:hypothetical protein